MKSIKASKYLWRHKRCWWSGKGAYIASNIQINHIASNTQNKIIALNIQINQRSNVPILLLLLLRQIHLTYSVCKGGTANESTEKSELFPILAFSHFSVDIFFIGQAGSSKIDQWSYQSLGHLVAHHKSSRSLCLFWGHDTTN